MQNPSGAISQRSQNPIVGLGISGPPKASGISSNAHSFVLSRCKQLSAAFAQCETENDCFLTLNEGNLQLIMIGGGHEE